MMSAVPVPDSQTARIYQLVQELVVELDQPILLYRRGQELELAVLTHVPQNAIDYEMTLDEALVIDPVTPSA